MKRILGCALLFLAGFNPWIQAATWHVGPQGLDTNPGTAAQPVRQIREAIRRATPGTTILIADGNYLGFDIDEFAGRVDAPLILRALGTNAVVLVTTDRGDNRDTIFINKSTFVTVEGLRSFNANRAALRIQGGDHVTIRRCVFGNNGRWGILTGHSPDLLIEENECFGSIAEHGIYVANSGDRPVVRGNLSYDNFGGGIQLNADVNTPPGDGIITGALLENNILWNNGRGGGGAFNLDGIQDSIVRNNLLFTNHASGIIFFQIDGAEGPRGNQILNNTIDMASDGRWALGIKQTTGTNYVRNNILFNRHSFRGGIQYAAQLDADRTDSDYNIVNHLSVDDGNSRITLAQRQAQGRELNSRTGGLTNLFLDADARNYYLRTNSPALNTALAVANVVTDREGNLRPASGWDIGCHELSPLSVHWVTQSGTNRVVIARGGSGQLLHWEASSTLTNWSPAGSVQRNHLTPRFQVPSTNRFFLRARWSP